MPVGSVKLCLPWVEKFIAEAAAKGIDTVYYPETNFPGLRGQYFPVEVPRPGELRETRDQVTRWAAAHPILIIIPMEWPGGTGLLNAAFVTSSTGEILGCQTKPNSAKRRPILRTRTNPLTIRSQRRPVRGRDFP